jgi:hypothetical protein
MVSFSVYHLPTAEATKNEIPNVIEMQHKKIFQGKG